MPQPDNSSFYSILFTITDKIGALDNVLGIIKRVGVSLSRIESRPSKTSEFDYDFEIEFRLCDPKDIDKIMNAIKPAVKYIKLIGSMSEKSENIIPWFPRRLSDLDSFANKTLQYGAELSADHPGFKDPEYRKRRDEITVIAKTYKIGQPIPRIDYTQDEIRTWGTVFEKLTSLYPTHACREHQYVFPLLIQNCGYTKDNIPQLEDISKFLKECTGFTLRPVTGLLSSRDFLNGLAFRVFHSTQYIRHHSQPFYTPEPDVCHELLGHVPLFADPNFASFSQEIGLCSLGASDEDIEKLATIYWFTVEFGLCKEGDSYRAYGAGILSSFGELEYCLTSKPEKRIFDPAKTCVQKYPITEYQPVYFVAESFKDAQEKVRNFSHTLERGFTVRYNPYTQTIDVLDTKEKILQHANTIQTDLSLLLDSIKNLKC
ncbi:tyrosine 3-monooxygenase [Rozella allomycis CSF55]|uniref:phenylalanine 4-monooxygenase n=1 Tax=Rozella allomycis (strain CSF55) TaxID=988480 RepID=A0A4V1J058_ROZAC|nr:tyrosine 3-monooxygenase [Rozella allomycis CSF55]